jgi:hypothetical protein
MWPCLSIDLSTVEDFDAWVGCEEVSRGAFFYWSIFVLCLKLMINKNSIGLVKRWGWFRFSVAIRESFQLFNGNIRRLELFV